MHNQKVPIQSTTIYTHTHTQFQWMLNNYEKEQFYYGIPSLVVDTELCLKHLRAKREINNCKLMNN